jgi:ribosomal protein S18 acetylase RimI-like enzyme
MSQEQKIVELHEQNEPEYMEIIIKAFQDSPQVPALIKTPERTETILRSLIKLYKKTGSIKVFGIKKDDMLMCVGLCIDSDSKPGFFRTIRFGFSLLLSLGFIGVRQFWIYNKNKPTYDKKCLELIFYGTRSMYQQKGYGRSMLNFLYEYAKKSGYGGVTGVTNTSRPAFHFYMRDGWIVDKEFTIGNYKICWVRRIV